MKKYWRPKHDITAYEVAYLFGRMVGHHGGILSIWTGGITFTQEQWDNEVPQEMKRHFEDAPK